MEPLSYTNAPIGLNFLIAGYGYQWGDVLVDPSLPIKHSDAKVHTAVLAYARVLDFWGQSGTFALIVPYAWLSATGEVAGPILWAALDATCSLLHRRLHLGERRAQQRPAGELALGRDARTDA